MCNDWTCPLNNGYGCTVTACRRHMVDTITISNSNILINIDVVAEYKRKLKQNLKDLFMQPGIITEHAVFDVIDRTE